MYYRSVLLLALAFAAAPLFCEDVLPSGGGPAPLEFTHFPDRLHAFVFRNWNTVPAAKLAEVLGTSPEHVRSLAAAMGLPPEDPLPGEHIKRLYITLIRRNWHLLPYEQLLTLLDMTPAQLAYTLREDDFLWHKLGGLKPRCDRLGYTPPTPQTTAREAAIKSLIIQTFGDELKLPAEPRFEFLKTFTQPIASPPPPANPAPSPPRFLYSYFAVYGDPLSDPSLDPYPDALLSRLRELGVNGVWLHVVLRDLAPSADFPEFGAGSDRRLQNLAGLVARAKRFGIGIYLYMNEPRAMPADFFKNRPDLAGVREGDHVAMCTSAPVVRQWLTASLAHVFSAAPDLAGVFTISASENQTNCASHHRQQDCPRCKGRPAAEIIAEVNAAIEAGVHRGSPAAKVIVWDWGWKDEDAPAVIAALPKSCQFMSVSEWSLPIERGGIKTTVGEYSISAVGPGPRATKHWSLAQAAGLHCVAKVQVNNTWEISAIPWLPTLDLVADHAANLSAAGIDGLMLSWTLGGYPSPNLDLVRRLTLKPSQTKDAALDAIATERYGPAGAPHARKAWTLFSNAFRQYPYGGSVMYTCPVQFGPSNLLFPKKTGYSATMIGFPYDDVNRWRGPYPAEVFASQFEKLAAGWKDGIAELQLAVRNSPPELTEEARHDLLLARAALLHFRSVANQTRFVLARNAMANGATVAARRKELLDQMRKLLEDESSAARELFTLARADSRIGFEASNHYYYLPQDLIEKVLNCEDLLAHLPKE